MNPRAPPGGGEMGEGNYGKFATAVDADAAEATADAAAAATLAAA